MKEVILVALGGGLGAVFRYLLSKEVSLLSKLGLSLWNGCCECHRIAVDGFFERLDF